MLLINLIFLLFGKVPFIKCEHSVQMSKWQYKYYCINLSFLGSITIRKLRFLWILLHRKLVTKMGTYITYKAHRKKMIMTKEIWNYE